MARAKNLIRLVSTEGSGIFFVKKKNPKGNLAQTKLAFKKYDKKLRRHVMFKEAKIK